MDTWHGYALLAALALLCGVTWLPLIFYLCARAVALGRMRGEDDYCRQKGRQFDE